MAAEGSSNDLIELGEDSHPHGSKGRSSKCSHHKIKGGSKEAVAKLKAKAIFLGDHLRLRRRSKRGCKTL